MAIPKKESASITTQKIQTKRRRHSKRRQSKCRRSKHRHCKRRHSSFNPSVNQFCSNTIFHLFVFLTYSIEVNLKLPLKCLKLCEIFLKFVCKTQKKCKSNKKNRVDWCGTNISLFIEHYFSRSWFQKFILSCISLLVVISGFGPEIFQKLCFSGLSTGSQDNSLPLIRRSGISILCKIDQGSVTTFLNWITSTIMSGRWHQIKAEVLIPETF